MWAPVGQVEFCVQTPAALQGQFNSLQTQLSLDENNSCPYVFIIDKKRTLRGRNDDEGVELFGFDATSVAEINNKMVDDVK